MINRIFRVTLTLLLLINIHTLAQQVNEPDAFSEDWSQPYPPFRIAGNLYYVGTADLACYLITTTEGNILINTGLAASASSIEDNIATLGFKITDTKILLTTQAHFDHVGALAELQKKTGAKIWADAHDTRALEDGGVSDYELGRLGVTFVPMRVDRSLNDGDKIMLGNQEVTMLHHPGHTKGSCSYLLDVRDDQRTYRVLIANLPSIITDKKFTEIPEYPGIAADYAFTFKSLKELSFDLWVASHASQFGLHSKHKPGDPYNPMKFADRAGYDKAVAQLEISFRKKLE